jgi:hypothetical protein
LHDSEVDGTKVVEGPGSFQKVSVGRQALRRELNDRVCARRAEDAELEVLCECGRASCRDALVVPREVYEKLRRVPTRFLITHSHAGASGRVVDSHESFLIIEKLDSGGVQPAEASPPRSGSAPPGALDAS